MRRRWKARVNAALTRTTGYKIVRASSSSPRTTTKPRPAPSARPRPAPAFPVDYDDQARHIIEAVRPDTMTHDDKLFALISATRYVVDHDVPGDVVECGVWRGGSMQAVARTLIARGDVSRDLYLFDTFEGMPPPTDKDVRHDGVAAETLLATNPPDSQIWAVAGVDEVREGFTGIPYPSERIHLVDGMVEQTVPARAPAQISILRLDTDWYESTRHELEHLYPRLVHGGVLIIDDYGWFDGSRQAVDEYLERTGQRLLLLRIASGRIAVKP